MRVTGGRARGIPLKAPSKGEVRPATDYLREAVFSSLGPRIPEARVLDLFAGSGAYGLEALSRGAASVSFIEKDRRCLACLKENLAAVRKALGIDAPADIASGDALRWKRDEPLDIVFCDPPYPLWKSQSAPLAELFERIASENGAHTFVLEAPGGSAPAIGPSLSLLKRIGKGNTQPAAWVFRATHASD